jgi:branched-chain amino acid transport system substrate-binding protein
VDPTYRAEGRQNALHILHGRPGAKMIVAEQSFEWADPTVDSQIVSLKASGADTLFAATARRQATQAIQKAWNIGWRPAWYSAVPATSPKAILGPAGLEKSVGMISAYYAKDPTQTQWKDDPAIKDYYAWARNYFDGDADDGIAAYGYQLAQALEHVLRACGDNLSRENVMKVATSLRNVEFPMLLPGVKINTGPADYYPIRQFQMQRFDGAFWVPFGDLVTED